MNWSAVRDHLLHEATKAYEDAQNVGKLAPGCDDVLITPHLLQMHAIQMVVHTSRGDILKTLASAINEGLKP